MCTTVSQSQAKFGLSQRAAKNSIQDSPWDAVERLMANLWSTDNPDGLVFLGVAENNILHQEVATRINKNLDVNPSDHMGYGVGPRGSPRLKKTLVPFFNSEFRPFKPILQKEFLILPGVAAVIDALTWSICNEGEGIITPTPFYTGFKPMSSVRAGGVLIPAPFQSVEGYRDLDDIFDPGMNKKALENTFTQAAQDGVKVRAVMISNPHNPLGRCYPAETLKEIAHFCGRNNLHLISDEIFALSVYANPHATTVTPFTSVLGVDLSDCIDHHLLHVMYGMGKDFGATGLRLGVLHSRNEGLIAAVSSISVFGWVPYVTQDMWSDILEDEEFLSDYKLKNREALAKHSTILRSLLDQENIPYYTNMHAGVFVWVDLRRYLPKRSSQEIATSVGGADRDREAKLFKRFLESGVVISQGSSFATEDLGWFRISFAVEEHALHVGLKRLKECLESIETDGWET